MLAARAPQASLRRARACRASSSARRSPLPERARRRGAVSDGGASEWRPRCSPSHRVPCAGSDGHGRGRAVNDGRAPRAWRAWRKAPAHIG
eukprot:2072921-Prymnesium_polylepis.1